MAANLKEAVANFRNQAGPFRAMLDVLDHIETLGDAQAAASEAAGHVAKAQEDVRKAQAEVGRAQTQAAQIVDDAKAEAENILAKARATADNTVDAANRKRSAIENDTTAKQEAAALALIEAQNETAVEQAKVNALREEAEQLEARVAAAKAAVAKLMEG